MRTEDGRIIYKCLNGEPEAFGLLVDKYKAGIYAFTYAKLLNFQDAQDVTQDVFEQAYRGLHGLRRWENFSTSTGISPASATAVLSASVESIGVFMK